MLSLFSTVWSSLRACRHSFDICLQSHRFRRIALLYCYGSGLQVHSHLDNITSSRRDVWTIRDDYLPHEILQNREQTTNRGLDDVCLDLLFSCLPYTTDLDQPWVNSNTKWTLQWCYLQLQLLCGPCRSSLITPRGRLWTHFLGAARSTTKNSTTIVSYSELERCSAKAGTKTCRDHSSLNDSRLHFWLVFVLP